MTTRRNFDTLTPEILISINEKNLPVEIKSDLKAVSVSDEVDAVSVFAITLACWDGVNMKVKWIDDDWFKVGNVVEIKMGYLDKLKNMLTGEITGVEPEFTHDAPPVMTVIGYDRGHRLMRQRKTLSYLNQKDSEIANQIASNNGFKPDVVDTKVKLAYVLQHNQTDLEFLRQRAQRIGYEVGVKEQTLYFRPRRNNSKEELTLSREVEILEFYPKLSTIGQLESVTVNGWDPKKKEAITAESKTGDIQSLVGADKTGPATVKKAFSGTSGGLSTYLSLSSQAEADELAKGWFKEMSLEYVTGDGIAIGLPELRAGTMINIEKLGERFSGKYYVTGTEHSYTPKKGYRTAFSVRRDATK